MAKPTLYVIIIKMLADELRKKYPQLRIEGHPQPSPRLVIRNRETENGLDIRIDVYKPFGTNRVSGNPVIFFASLHKARSKVGWPHAEVGNNQIVIDLDDEHSFDKLDKWVIPILEKYVIPAKEEKEPEQAKQDTTSAVLWGTQVAITPVTEENKDA